MRCFPHRTPMFSFACLGQPFTWLCFAAFGSSNLPRSSKLPTPCVRFVLFSGYRLRVSVACRFPLRCSSLALP